MNVPCTVQILCVCDVLEQRKWMAASECQSTVQRGYMGQEYLLDTFFIAQDTAEPNMVEYICQIVPGDFGGSACKGTR